MTPHALNVAIARVTGVAAPLAVAMGLAVPAAHATSPIEVARCEGGAASR